MITIEQFHQLEYGLTMETYWGKDIIAERLRKIIIPGKLDKNNYSDWKNVRFEEAFHIRKMQVKEAVLIWLRLNH